MAERACIGESVPALSYQSLVPVYCRIIVFYKLKPTRCMLFICNVKGGVGGRYVLLCFHCWFSCLFLLNSCPDKTCNVDWVLKTRN